MKKSIPIIVVSMLVIGTCIFWLLNSGSLASGDIVQLGIVVILIILGLIVAWKRVTAEKRGQPAEDEMSKKIMQKASSTAYFISIYLWLVVMYLADKTDKPHDIMFGWGILGMGILLALCYLFYYFRGIRHE